MWYTYILLCRGLVLYTGATNDVQKRFREHLSGVGAKYTRSHKPIKIIHIESFATKSEALKREAEIKSWPRSKKITALRLSF